MDLPQVFRDETVIEDLHGIKVSDPYRWLENPDSDETKAFVDEQNSLTTSYLTKCQSKKQVKEKLTEIWNYPKFSCPSKRGSRFFFFMNTGLQNQSVMYVQSTINGEPKVFLDPNAMSEDGTIALSTYAFSEDGEIFAYGLSKSGSDWISIHFKKVSTGEDYPEVLQKVKFSQISWTHDHRGIFYGFYPEHDGKSDGTETTSNENQKLYYHRVGTEQEQDILVVEFPEHPRWRIHSDVSDCGKYLIVSTILECKDNQLYFCSLPDCLDGPLNLTCIVGKFEADYEYITNDGSVSIFRTNKNAPNYQLIKIDFNDPKESSWKTFLPEHDKNVLDWAACVNKDKLVVCFIVDVKSVLEIRSLTTSDHLYTVPLEIGTISGYSGKRYQDEMFYYFMSFLSPGTVYHLDFKKEPYQPEVFREVEIPNFDSSNFTAKQVFYPSKDGTKVPMFIVHSKDANLEGEAPTMLYAYGGFNISIQPNFSVPRLFFMDQFKGIFALANIRGGGEYGESWHNAGRQLNIQNAFNDFQAAADYLIKEKYTTNKKLIIQGGSHGGMLVGCCVNQRPELYGAAIAHVGVMDMMRFHKFTIGSAWTSNYGSPDVKEEFENIWKFSPLHNVKKREDTQYPCMLLLTGDHDDRVSPLHSLKHISTLQYTLSGDPKQTNPLLIRIDTKAGHGRGLPTHKLIDEYTDIYSFLVVALGLDIKL